MACGATQREPRSFALAENGSRMPARRRLCSSSVRALRPAGVINPFGDPGLRLPVSFDAREGPLSSREGCCRCLGLLRMPLQGRFALGGLLNKWRRGLAGGGVQGMCGRHSKDQCTPAGFGSVERATEVVARPGRGPIPPLCGGLVRRPVRRCSSLQFNTNHP